MGTICSLQDTGFKPMLWLPTSMLTLSTVQTRKLDHCCESSKRENWGRCQFTRDSNLFCPWRNSNPTMAAFDLTEICSASLLVRKIILKIPNYVTRVPRVMQIIFIPQLVNVGFLFKWLGALTTTLYYRNDLSVTPLKERVSFLRWRVNIKQNLSGITVSLAKCSIRIINC